MLSSSSSKSVKLPSFLVGKVWSVFFLPYRGKNVFFICWVALQVLCSSYCMLLKEKAAAILFIKVMNIEKVCNRGG